MSSLLFLLVTVFPNGHNLYPIMYTLKYINLTPLVLGVFDFNTFTLILHSWFSECVGRRWPLWLRDWFLDIHWVIKFSNILASLHSSNTIATFFRKCYGIDIYMIFQLNIYFSFDFRKLSGIPCLHTFPFIFYIFSIFPDVLT